MGHPCSCVEYASTVGNIFPKTLPKPVLCAKSNVHCPRTVQCYSDFEPHFNPKMYLSELLVGPLKWERQRRGESLERWIQFGYNDTKWKFSSENAHDKLVVRVKVGSLGVVQFCVQDGSADPDFFVDLSVPNPGPDYVPQNVSNKYVNIRRVGTACGNGRKPAHLGVELFGLPPGDHIISVVNKYVTISHVLMWPGD